MVSRSHAIGSPYIALSRYAVPTCGRVEPFLSLRHDVARQSKTTYCEPSLKLSLSLSPTLFTHYILSHSLSTRELKLDAPERGLKGVLCCCLWRRPRALVTVHLENAHDLKKQDVTGAGMFVCLLAGSWKASMNTHVVTSG